MQIPKQKYKEILEVLPIACIDLVIVNNGKILLAKRTNNPAKGQWFLPGGRILKGEKLKDAAIRKAKEEIGISVKIIKPLIFDETIFEESSMKEVKSGAHTINVSFLVEAENKKIFLDEQNSEFKWIDKIDKNLHPYVKKVINASNILRGKKLK